MLILKLLVLLLSLTSSSFLCREREKTSDKNWGVGERNERNGKEFEGEEKKRKLTNHFLIVGKSDTRPGIRVSCFDCKFNFVFP